MPTIKFKDGTEKIVDYQTGAKIWRVLEENAKPENKKQAAYVERVERVVFDVEKPNASEAEKAEKPAKIDPEMQKILNNKALSGREKARKIHERIKKRAAEKADKTNH